MTPPLSQLTLAQLARDLQRAHPPRASLRLDIDGLGVHVRSSSTALLGTLRHYYGELVTESVSAEPLELVAIDAGAPELPFPFRPWPREAGKSGSKESVADTPGGRIIRKLSSGLCFLLTRREIVAVGPCAENPNQLINCIVALCISRQLHRGWQLCHAAGVAAGERGLGIAARSGAGKSTLALHLMNGGLSFISNDRLLVRGSSTGAEVAGVPKMPRVNAGTLLNNPALAGILPSQRRAELSRLEPRELWELEEKYDVIVSQVYGRGRVQSRAALSGLLILNWEVDAELPLRFEPVRLEERRDLLCLLMKSPGPFHRDPDGRAARFTAQPDPAGYLRALSGVPVIEATGRADFALAVGECRRLLGL